MTTSPNPTTTQRSREGKYLTFLMDRESYGVEVTKVREIIRMQPITPVPQMPAYVKGVINLRGKIIPVIDLRLRFGLPETEVTDATCIVVVQSRDADDVDTYTGLVVDGVEEVLSITAGDIENSPNFGVSVEAESIIGMAKIKGTVKTLLDIERIVSGVGSSV